MSPASTPSTRLTNRYGTPKPARSPRRARLLGVSAVLAAVVAAGTYALTSGAGAVDVKDVGFSLGSGDEVGVDFEVTKDRSATARCAVQALSENYAVVGWKIVTIGPAADGTGDGRTTAQRTEVRIDSPAVSAGVEKCWIVED